MGRQKSTWTDKIAQGSYVLKGEFIFKDIRQFPILGEYFEPLKQSSEDSWKKLQAQGLGIFKACALSDLADRSDLSKNLLSLKGDSLKDEVFADAGSFELLFSMLNFADSRIIVRIGERRWDYNPLIEEPGLYIAFANLQASDQRILAFVNKYGALGYHGLGGSLDSVMLAKRGEVWSEPLEWFQREQSEFKRLYSEYKELRELTEKTKKTDYWKSSEQQQREDSARIGDLTHDLTMGLNEGLRGVFALFPQENNLILKGWKFTNLRQALYLQLYQAYADWKKIVTCPAPNCGKDFEARENQEYCSPRCRSRKVMQEIRKAKKEEAPQPQKEKKSPGRKRKPVS